MRTSTVRSAILAFFVAALVPSPHTRAAADEWPGFRGQDRQGVGDSRVGPTHWSSTANIAWKTRLPGSGHSSPVVIGRQIFVTTAYEVAGGQSLRRWTHRLRAGLALIALALWLRLSMQVVWWQRLSAGLLVTILAGLALVDEQLFQFSRSPARAWLGASAALIVGLSVSVYGLEMRARTRRAIALGLALTPIVIGFRMPQATSLTRAHAFALAVMATVALGSAVAVLLGLFAGSPAQPPTRLRLRVSTLWRGCVLAAATLGFVASTTLAPRTTWVRAIASVDRSDGHLLWTREGLWAPKEAVHYTNSQATPTPVTDGQRVFAYFGTPGLMAVGSNGSLLWTTKAAPFQTLFGVGTSPVLVNDTLVIASTTPSSPYVAAFDPATGQERWRATRVGVHPEFGDSRTPLVRTIGQRTVVVVVGRQELAGHDLSTGHELWRVSHGANHRLGSMVASMLAKDDVVYLPLDNGMVALNLTRAAAGEDPVVWTSKGGASGNATPVLYEGLIFAVSSGGIATCTNASTGELLWRTRLSGGFDASPVAMAGKVYFTNDAGVTTVVAADSRYQKLAENDLGEAVTATPAAVDGNLYLRGHEHLYCIRP
jgi:outer membrane protein assembly factor BamB